MTALIVEELRPSVFRRVGLWRPRLGPESNACRTAYDMFTSMLEELKKESYGEFWLPCEEELLPEMKWEKRTLTVVWKTESP